ncbi:MAG: hypothetical protein ACOYKZ_06655 [Chlamydiia bacterium]
MSYLRLEGSGPPSPSSSAHSIVGEELFKASFSNSEVNDAAIEEKVTLLTLNRLTPPPAPGTASRKWVVIEGHRALRDAMRRGGLQAAEDVLDRCDAKISLQDKPGLLKRWALAFVHLFTGTRALTYKQATQEVSRILVSDGIRSIWLNNSKTLRTNLKEVVDNLRSDDLMKQAIGRAALPYLILQLDELHATLRYLGVQGLILDTLTEMRKALDGVNVDRAQLSLLDEGNFNMLTRQVASDIGRLDKNQHILFERADKLVGHGFSLDDAVYRELFTDANPDVEEFLVLRGQKPSASAQASNSAQTSASALAGLIGEEDASVPQRPRSSSPSSEASSSTSAFSAASTLVHDQAPDIRALSKEATAENQWRTWAEVFMRTANKAITSSREYRTSSPLPQMANHQLAGQLHLAELGDLVNITEAYLAKPPSLVPLDAVPSRAQQDKTVQELAHLKRSLQAEYGDLAAHMAKSEPTLYAPRIRGHLQRFDALLARAQDLTQLKATKFHELERDLQNLERVVRSDLEKGKESDSLLEGPTEAATLRTLSDNIRDLKRQIGNQQAANATSFSADVQKLRVELRKIRSGALSDERPFHNGPAPKELKARLKAIVDQLRLLNQPENLPFDYTLVQNQVHSVAAFLTTAETLLKLVNNLIELDEAEFFETASSSPKAAATGQHRQRLETLRSENSRLIEQLTKEVESEQRRV